MTTVEYDFDPELAAAIPVLPVLDLTDLPGARARLSELRAELPASDETGVTVTEVRVPPTPHPPAPPT